MFELHDFPRSSAAYRVRIALAWKNLDYTKMPVDLLKGEQHGAEFRALNPHGLVPVYSDEQATLSQSLAIIEYLNERYPEPPLLPQGMIERAQCRQFAYLVAADIHPLNGYRVHTYLRDVLAVDPKGRRRWFMQWLLDGLDALEVHLAAGRTSRRYCIGDQVSLADVCLVPQLALARRNRIDLEDFPRLVDIESACMELPAFTEAHADFGQQN